MARALADRSAAGGVGGGGGGRCGGGWRRRGRAVGPATAQRQRQCGLGFELARLQVQRLGLLGQQQRIGLQHRQAVAQAGGKALLGDGPGIGRGRLGLRLFGQLLRQAAQAGGGVGHLAGGVQHRGVVGGHGGIGLGGTAAQLGAQHAAVEQRQAKRRAHAELAAAQVQQPIQAQRI